MRKIFGVVAAFLIVLLIGNIISNFNEKVAILCAKKGCISSHRPNSRYCYDHDPDTEKDEGAFLWKF